MEEIKINLFKEELDSLNKGKEICLYEDEGRDILIKLRYEED